MHPHEELGEASTTQSHEGLKDQDDLYILLHDELSPKMPLHEYHQEQPGTNEDHCTH